MTTALYNIIQSELIKKGHNEFVDENGRLALYDPEYQFMTKILTYDDDVSEIIDHLFNGLSLDQRAYDIHFKKSFIYRFVNRNINRQTVESFKLVLMSTFLTHQHFLNTVYADLDKYITQEQTSDNSTKQANKQDSEGTTTTDNRQAFQQLPQDNVQLDVDSTVMTSATDNTISRNKQTNKQLNDGETTGESHTANKVYHFDQLFKSNGLLENVLNEFDKKCFSQFW